jgi:hypothetical protein
MLKFFTGGDVKYTKPTTKFPVRRPIYPLKLECNTMTKARLATWGVTLNTTRPRQTFKRKKEVEWVKLYLKDKPSRRCAERPPYIQWCDHEKSDDKPLNPLLVKVADSRRNHATLQPEGEKVAWKLTCRPPEVATNRVMYD